MSLFQDISISLDSHKFHNDSIMVRVGQWRNSTAAVHDHQIGIGHKHQVNCRGRAVIMYMCTYNNFWYDTVIEHKLEYKGCECFHNLC